MSFQMERSNLLLALVLLAAADVCGQPQSRGDWTNLGSNGRAITAIAASPSSPRTIYVATAVPGGVYRTDDGGGSWSAVAAGLPDGTGVGSMISFFPLAVDSAAPKTAYIGWRETFLPPFTQLSRTNLYRTLDGGSSWLFLPVDAGNVLTTDPSSPAKLYLATSNGILRSDDRGGSWRGPFGPSNAADLALNPANTSTIFAASSGSGVFRSADGGISWTAIDNGLEQDGGKGISASSIAIDPNDPGVLYVAAGPLPTPTTRVLYKTVDSGATWRRVVGQPAGDVLQVRVAGASPTAVYCLMRTEDGNQLYRSLNQGASWANITANLPPPTLVEVSPGEPATIYVGTDSAGLFTRTFLARTESSRTVPFRR